MQFAADLHRLQQMLAFIRSEAQIAGFEEKEVNKIELAVEEALVNIIYYAYAQQALGNIEIACRSPRKRALEIDLVDRGPPFNPLEGGNIDPEATAEERQIGGLGLFLMRQLMDEVVYNRRGDSNILTLIKRS